MRAGGRRNVCVCVWTRDESRRLQRSRVKGGDMHGRGECGGIHVLLKVSERQRVGVLRGWRKDSTLPDLPPFSKYKIIWRITHLKALLCNNTLCLILPKAFSSGRTPSDVHCLFCPVVYICHLSKTNPGAEYFTDEKLWRIDAKSWVCRMIHIYLVFKSQVFARGSQLGNLVYSV